jgi:hypothetical protein
LQLEAECSSLTMVPIYQATWHQKTENSYLNYLINDGACGSIVVKALCYKPGGCRFETQWGEWVFSIYLIIPVALSPGDTVQPVRKADNFAFICLDNVGSLTSHNPIGLHGLLWG